jgi:phasin family protein
MSLLTAEQFAAAQKANLDICFGLTSKVVEGIEKLVELNQQAIRSTLSESRENALNALSPKEPRDWITLPAALSAPIPERIQSYSRQVFDIASSIQGEFARLAQAQCEAYNKRVQRLVDDVAKSSPAGSEAAIAAWKAAVTATNTLVETVQKSYQQAAQAAESNFAAATTAASKATRRASEQASAAAK